MSAPPFLLLLILEHFFLTVPLLALRGAEGAAERARGMWCVVHVYGFTVESYSRQVIDYRRVMVLRRGGTYSRIILTQRGRVLQLSLRGNLVHGEYSRITSSKERGRSAAKGTHSAREKIRRWGYPERRGQSQPSEETRVMALRPRTPQG